MSDSSSLDDRDAAGAAAFPDDAALPPVEPPSAGFIVQLFVVPALIVAAVIGVYLLFGKLASSEVDWRELVIDLRSSNSHTRWRGANGLAQLLEADSLRQRTDAADPAQPVLPLTQDADLANELAATLTQELPKTGLDDDHARLLEYLIKSLGWIDVPEVVLPALQQAWDQSSDPFLRQQALIALGMVAGRAQTRGQPLDAPDLTDFLIEITQGETGVQRHLATYDLGFLTDAMSQSRLRELLVDADPKTRVNAAIGIARSGSLDSLPVFEMLLQQAARESFDPQSVKTEAEAEAYFERTQLATNALTATELLQGTLAPEQRAQLVALVEPLTSVADVELRHKAITARHALQQGGSSGTP